MVPGSTSQGGLLFSFACASRQSSQIVRNGASNASGDYIGDPTRRFPAPVQKPPAWGAAQIPIADYASARNIRYSPAWLLPLAAALDERHVAVNGQIGETLNGSAGLGPNDFYPIDLGAISDPEHHARIMR